MQCRWLLNQDRTSPFPFSKHTTLGSQQHPGRDLLGKSGNRGGKDGMEMGWSELSLTQNDYLVNSVLPSCHTIIYSIAAPTVPRTSLSRIVLNPFPSAPPQDLPSLATPPALIHPTGVLNSSPLVTYSNFLHQIFSDESGSGSNLRMIKEARDHRKVQ